MNTSNKSSWFLTDRFGKKYIFDKNRLLIGRKNCDIILKSISVNYKHCCLLIDELNDTLKVKDYSTVNGTCINNDLIKPDNWKLLQIGDIIKLGYDQVTFTVNKETREKVSASTIMEQSDTIERPHFLTEPERNMPTLLCDLNDSHNTDNMQRPQHNPSNENAYDGDDFNTNGQHSPNQNEWSSNNQTGAQNKSTDDSLRDRSRPIGKLDPSNERPSESFTVDLERGSYVVEHVPHTLHETNDEEPKDTVDEGPAMGIFFVGETSNEEKQNTGGLSSFVPSKLRASFENRDKAKRRTNQIAQNSSISSFSKSSKYSGSPRSSKDDSQISCDVSKKSTLTNKTVSKINNNIIKKPTNQSIAKLSNMGEKSNSKLESKVDSRRPSNNISERSMGCSEKKRPLQKKTPSNVKSTVVNASGAKNQASTTDKSRRIKCGVDGEVEEVNLPVDDKENCKQYLIGKMFNDQHSIEQDLEEVVGITDVTMEYLDEQQALCGEVAGRTDGTNVLYETYNRKKFEENGYRSRGALEVDSDMTTSQLSIIAPTINLDVDATSETGTYVIDDDTPAIQDIFSDKVSDNLDLTTKEITQNPDGDDDNSSTISSNFIGDVEEDDYKKGNRTEIESKSTPTKWISSDYVLSESHKPSDYDLNAGEIHNTAKLRPHDVHYNDNNFIDPMLMEDQMKMDMLDNYNYAYRSDITNNSVAAGYRDMKTTSRDYPRPGSNQYLNSAMYQRSGPGGTTPSYMGGEEDPTLLIYDDTNLGPGGHAQYMHSGIFTPANYPVLTHTPSRYPQQQQQHYDHLGAINHGPPPQKYYPRSTFSVASLDTALLLQDTEALLNDMEKRVYSRREVLPPSNTSGGQQMNDIFNEPTTTPSGSLQTERSAADGILSSTTGNDKIPYVDEAMDDDNYDDNINNNDISERSSRLNSELDYDFGANDASSSKLHRVNNNRISPNLQTPGSSSVRRNNSMKVTPHPNTNANSSGNAGPASAGVVMRNQRSCSMIEDTHYLSQQRRGQSTGSSIPPGMDLLPDHRLSTNVATQKQLPPPALHLRRNSQQQQQLYSPSYKMEAYPYNNSSGLGFLPLHRQRMNRYEYGQHSLKHNSSSTTMLYQKPPSNYSPPLNYDDPIGGTLINNTIGPTGVGGIFNSRSFVNRISDPDNINPYNTMPNSFDRGLFTRTPRHTKLLGNSQPLLLNIDSSLDAEFMRRNELLEELALLKQHQMHTNNNSQQQRSGRSSAFSPVNSLHHSTESINQLMSNLTQQQSLPPQHHLNIVTTKSRSSLAINEQNTQTVGAATTATAAASSLNAQCRQTNNYDLLLVSSIHHFSARLCRYTEEIVHKLRREDPELLNNSSSPINAGSTSSSSMSSNPFGKLKSVNKELSESLSNMRNLEKLLQKIDRAMFPSERSGRSGTMGSCSETSYLNQLERINKEIKEFVPISETPKACVQDLTTVEPTLTTCVTAMPSKTSSTNNPTNNNQSNNLSSNTPTNNPINKPTSSTKKSASYNTTTSASSGTTSTSSKSKYSSLSKRFQSKKD